MSAFQVFTAVIKKFGDQGEKTGWSYLEIPAAIAGFIKPGSKRSFRVSGKLDHHTIEKLSILPMGGGDFILPLNGAVRKAIGKNKGAMVGLQLAEDVRDLELSPEMMECLNDEPSAREKFFRQPPSHQRYFSNWVMSAKTAATRANRIAAVVSAMMKNMNYAEMIRKERDNRL